MSPRSAAFSLLFTFILALTLSASASPVVVNGPPVSLKFAKRFNFTGSGKLIERDQKRVARLRARAQAKISGQPIPASSAGSVPAENQAVDYVATVTIGTPGTDYTLLIDTGSANTWVGAGQPFVESSTTVQTRDRVAVTYGSGSFSGTEFTDTVSLGPGLKIEGQSFGVATKSEGFSGVDGIIGIGPTDLTVDTLRPDTTSSIPTVTDNLFAQGAIPSDVVAISFEPTQALEDNNGELTFGGTDSSKFTGAITFASITCTKPASEFFGISQSITYGSTPILSSVGIVDTGTTLVLIATDALEKYQAATGAVFDDATGLLRISSAQYSALENLTFEISGVDFELTPNAQLWPRSLNTAIGGVADEIYLIIGSIGTPSGQGFDFVNGQMFLERFYAVFDTGNNRVGFANTPFTQATTN